MIEVLSALSSTFMLHAFFRAVASNWPHSYVSLSDMFELRITGHPLRYAAFRFLPVLVMALALSALLTSEGRNAGLGVAVMTISHLSVSVGLALVQLLRSKSSFARASLLVAYLGTASAIGLSGFVGWALSATPAAQLVPSAAVLVETLWTAVLAAILGAYVVTVSQHEPTMTSDLLTQARADATEDLQDLAIQEARAHNSDEHLILAILFAEVLQRPQWVRRLELLKSLIVKRGTYGAMQVAVPAPVSDRESIRMAVADRLRGIQIARDEWGYPDDSALRRAIRAYNSNGRYIQLVLDLYYELRHEQERNREPHK